MAVQCLHLLTENWVMGYILLVIIRMSCGEELNPVREWSEPTI